MPPKGRPSKLTPEVQEKICEGIRMCLPFELAVQRVGIHKDTFYEWLKRGKAEEGIYSAFSDAVKKAEADAALESLAIIKRAALGHTPKKGQEKGQWQAAAWLLERRYKEFFAVPKAQEVQQTVAPDDKARWASSPKEAGLALPGDSESESDPSEVERDDPLSKDDAK